jgi:hypothetical protein
MKRKQTLLIILLVATNLLTACNGLSSKQQTSAEDAMKALRKLGAATQVGVNYQQYGLLVIDAQAQVNDALAVLPEGELKKEMNAAMEAYVDAGEVWQAKIRGVLLDSNSALIPKYSLKIDKWGTVSPIDKLQPIWEIARMHSDRASSLLQK